ISGKIPNEHTKKLGKTSSDLINKKYLPTEEEDMIASSMFIRYNNFNYLPHPTTPADFIQEKLLVKRQRSNQAIFDEVTAIIERYPNAVTRPAAYFLTADRELNAPSDMDPRTDDG